MRYRIVLAANIALALVATPICSVAQDGVDLVTLAAENPNGFVKTVQSELAGLGYPDLPQHGMLDSSTIAAINALCRKADVLAKCQAGPLSPVGADAVVSALTAAKASQAAAAAPVEPAEAANPTNATDAPAPAEAPAAPAPAAEAPATPAPTAPAAPEEAPAAADAPEEAPAAAAAPEEVPAAPAQPSDGTPVSSSDWYGGTENGLTATPVASGDTGVTFSIDGVATGKGWVNAYASPYIEAKPGSAWTFKVDASFTSEANAGTAVVRMAAHLADGTYISELGKGIPLVGDGPFVFSGVAPDRTEFVAAFIQMIYPEGTEVNSQLKIVSASIGR